MVRRITLGAIGLLVLAMFAAPNLGCARSYPVTYSDPIACEIDRGTFEIWQTHQGNNAAVLVGHLYSSGRPYVTHTEAWALRANYHPPMIGGPVEPIEFRRHGTQYPNEGAFRAAHHGTSANYMLHGATRIP